MEKTFLEEQRHSSKGSKGSSVKQSESSQGGKSSHKDSSGSEHLLAAAEGAKVSLIDDSM